MTPDERLEALLNQCSQTIVDLPARDDYSIERKLRAANYISQQNWTPVTYVLHLTDIIDRMEIALNNLLVKLKENENGEDDQLPTDVGE